MTRLHGADLLVWAPVVGNLLLAAWAGLSSLRGRRLLSPAFWGMLLAVLALLIVQVLAGVFLFAGGARPSAGLHVLYGVLVLAAAVAQYGLRPRGFLRARVGLGSGFPEPRLMALLCFTQAALLMRAWMTGAFGR
ncbi:MAG: hypothetical protein ACRDF5_11750 [bacterium]